jgi:hypothetical protein
VRIAASAAFDHVGLHSTGSMPHLALENKRGQDHFIIAVRVPRTAAWGNLAKQMDLSPFSPPLLRTAHDLRALPTKAYGDACGKLLEIGKQSRRAGSCLPSRTRGGVVSPCGGICDDRLVAGVGLSLSGAGQEGRPERARRVSFVSSLVPSCLGGSLPTQPHSFITTSSRFSTRLHSIVHAACSTGSSVLSRGESPYVSNLFAASVFAANVALLAM